VQYSNSATSSAKAGGNVNTNHSMTLGKTGLLDTLTGWNNGKTAKPTSFMMVSKFISVVVAIKNGERSLFTPLNKVQLAYLSALEVNPGIFTEIMPEDIQF